MTEKIVINSPRCPHCGSYDIKSNCVCRHKEPQDWNEEYKNVKFLTVENDYHPGFRYRIHGRGPEFGFTISSVNEDRREWLVQVVCRQLYDAYIHGREEAKKEIKDSMSDLFEKVGIKI